jgi:dihydroorotate dehydrogenase (NAD+) catalytic subunit
MPNLSVDLAGIPLRNPLLTASGTFGYGAEYADFVDLNRLGAVVVKGITLEPRPGNPPPRTVETPAGMLNAIGLQNPGAAAFIEQKLPYLRQFDVPVIVNINARTVDEFAALARLFEGVEGVHGLEVNISCPNVREGGMEFSADPQAAFEAVRAVRDQTSLPLLVKLSPNVTDIRQLARRVVAAGADAVSLINTVVGMVIDVERRRPFLANRTGGLSGPAIRPIAVRMVWEVAEAVEVPIVGMGGIMTAHDALEFILAGATAVAVGTANFVHPRATMEILEGLIAYLQQQGIADIRELIGAAHDPR